MQNHRSGLAVLWYRKMVVLFLLQCVHLFHGVFFPFLPSQLCHLVDRFFSQSALAVDSTGIITHENAMSTSDVKYRTITWFGWEGGGKVTWYSPSPVRGTASIDQVA